MKKLICGMAGLFLAGALATGAQAGVYGWTITGPSGFSGSGQFTTEDVPTATPEDVLGTNSGPGYLLTSFTGTFANKVVRLKAWNPDDGPYYADNLFYAFGHDPYVDLDGILFETLKTNGSVAQVYNMFDSEVCGGDDGSCHDQALIGYPGIGRSKSVTFAITVITPVPLPSPVPETASWAMMLGGFGLIGAAMRRKRTAVLFA